MVGLVLRFQDRLSRSCREMQMVWIINGIIDLRYVLRDGVELREGAADKPARTHKDTHTHANDTNIWVFKLQDLNIMKQLHHILWFQLWTTSMTKWLNKWLVTIYFPSIQWFILCRFSFILRPTETIICQK